MKRKQKPNSPDCLVKQLNGGELFWTLTRAAQTWHDHGYKIVVLSDTLLRLHNVTILTQRSSTDCLVLIQIIVSVVDELRHICPDCLFTQTKSPIL